MELIQLVPVVSLALPFIASGKVDLSRAGTGLLVGALLTLPVSALVVWQKGTLNPILVGTALWLWLGAVAFGLPLPALRDRLIEAQGFGLFAAIALAGAVALVASPAGFIGMRHSDARFVRHASLALFALALIALAWSWVFRQNIRLGGGLPFIVLNLARRAIILRSERRSV